MLRLISRLYVSLPRIVVNCLAIADTTFFGLQRSNVEVPEERHCFARRQQAHSCIEGIKCLPLRLSKNICQGKILDKCRRPGEWASKYLWATNFASDITTSKSDDSIVKGKEIGESCRMNEELGVLHHEGLLEILAPRLLKVRAYMKATLIWIEDTCDGNFGRLQGKEACDKERYLRIENATFCAYNHV